MPNWRCCRRSAIDKNAVYTQKEHGQRKTPGSKLDSSLTKVVTRQSARREVRAWRGRQHRALAPIGIPVGPPAVLPRAAPAADTGSRSIRRRHPRSPGRSVELLQVLAPAVPDEMTVVVLWDRGLASPKLWQQIRAQSLPRRRPGAGIRFRFLLRGSPLRPLFPSQQQQRGQAALRPCCWCALRAFAYWCGRLPAAVSCWPVPAFAHLAAETDGVSLLTILGLPLRNINLLAISYDAYNRNPQSTQNPSVGGSVRSLMKGPQ